MRRSHRCELLHGISKSPMPPPRSPPRKSIEPPPIAAGSKPSGIGAGGSSAFRASSSSGDAAANAAKAATIGAEPPPALCCENGMRERVRKDKWQNRTRTDSLDSRKAITCKIERRLSRAANGLNDDLLVTIHLREFSQRHSVKRDGSQARDHLFLRSAQVSHVGVGTVAELVVKKLTRTHLTHRCTVTTREGSAREVFFLSEYKFNRDIFLMTGSPTYTYVYYYDWILCLRVFLIRN